MLPCTHVEPGDGFLTEAVLVDLWHEILDAVYGKRMLDITPVPDLVTYA